MDKLFRILGQMTQCCRRSIALQARNRVGTYNYYYRVRLRFRSDGSDKQCTQLHDPLNVSLVFSEKSSARTTYNRMQLRRRTVRYLFWSREWRIRTWELLWLEPESALWKQSNSARFESPSIFTLVASSTPCFCATIPHTFPRECRCNSVCIPCRNISPKGTHATCRPSQTIELLLLRNLPR